MSEKELAEEIEQIENPDKKQGLIKRFNKLLKDWDNGVVDLQGWERGKYYIKKEIDDLP